MRWTEITERRVGEVVILDLVGQMSYPEEPSVLQKVRDLVRDGRLKVLLNLRGTPHLDSVGLGEIAAAYTSVRRVGGVLKLCDVPRRVLELFEIARLPTVVEVFESEALALPSFAATRPQA